MMIALERLCEYKKDPNHALNGHVKPEKNRIFMK